MHFTWIASFWNSSMTFGKPSLQPTSYALQRLTFVLPQKKMTLGKWLNLNWLETAGLSLKSRSSLRAAGVCALGAPHPLPAGPGQPGAFPAGFPVQQRARPARAGKDAQPREGGADVAARQGPPPSGCGPPGAALLAPSGRARAGLREPGAAVQGAQSWDAGCSTPCLAAPEASFLPPFSSPRSPRPGLLRPPVPRGKKSLPRSGGRCWAARAPGGSAGARQCARIRPPLPSPQPESTGGHSRSLDAPGPLPSLLSAQPLPPRNALRKVCLSASRSPGFKASAALPWRRCGRGAEADGSGVLSPSWDAKRFRTSLGLSKKKSSLRYKHFRTVLILRGLCAGDAGRAGFPSMNLTCGPLENWVEVGSAQLLGKLRPARGTRVEPIEYINKACLQELLWN